MGSSFCLWGLSHAWMTVSAAICAVKELEMEAWMLWVGSRLEVRYSSYSSGWGSRLWFLEWSGIVKLGFLCCTVPDRAYISVTCKSKKYVKAK